MIGELNGSMTTIDLVTNDSFEHGMCKFFIGLSKIRGSQLGPI